MIDTFKECSALDMAKAEQVWKISRFCIDDDGKSEAAIIQCLRHSFNKTPHGMAFSDSDRLESRYADDKTRKVKRVMWNGKPHILVMETLV